MNGSGLEKMARMTHAAVGSPSGSDFFPSSTETRSLFPDRARQRERRTTRWEEGGWMGGQPGGQTGCLRSSVVDGGWTKNEAFGWGRRVRILRNGGSIGSRKPGTKKINDDNKKYVTQECQLREEAS